MARRCLESGCLKFKCYFYLLGLLDLTYSISSKYHALSDSGVNNLLITSMKPFVKLFRNDNICNPSSNPVVRDGCETRRVSLLIQRSHRAAECSQAVATPEQVGSARSEGDVRENNLFSWICF
jgi:hypothetical protein